MAPRAGGFVPPPYPYDRLDVLRRTADGAPGGAVDCSVGTPCDAVPPAVAAALAAAGEDAAGYPPSAGSAPFRGAAAEWIGRRFGVDVEPGQVAACVGTKEAVASLPHLLRLRDPARDTVLYPAVAYPSYAMGAHLAGCRAVPVPLDGDWHVDVGRVGEDDAARALVLWLNEPGNPAGNTPDDGYFAAAAGWARSRGVLVASDECYVEFASEPRTVLETGTDGVLALHSLSKRSNAAGLRAGFFAGDAEIVGYLAEVRKHAGLMVPGPVQAAAVAALGDQQHVAEQRERYQERRAMMLEGLRDVGLVHDGGPVPFYLWLRSERGDEDGWALAGRLARAGLVVAPGDLYGDGGAAHVRVALVQPTDRLRGVLDNLSTLTGLDGPCAPDRPAAP